MEQYREPVSIFLLFFLAWLLRRSIVMYPLMLLVTLLHECGHALAAVLTGGKAKLIKVSTDGSGVTATYGGSPFVIYNAGYLGSLLLGFLIFCLPYTGIGEYAFMILGILVIVIVVFWVRDIFTLLFALILAAGLIISNQFVPVFVCSFVSKFFGVCCVLYSFLDMNRYISNINKVSFLETDAQKLAQLTKIPAFFWGFAWRLISLGVLFLLFQLALNWRGF